MIKICYSIPMKRAFFIVITIGIIIFCLGLYFQRDNNGSNDTEITCKACDTVEKYPLNKIFPNPITITINGVDYLQSQLPVGRYGGRLIASTIGEGPKTFNPFTAKDATSSQMANIMYDGLVTSNPVTGEVIPKLAKSIKIEGNNYIVTLRHGLKWSDGQPITADDVIFTWKDIVFKGLGNTSVRDSILIDGKLPEIRKIDNYTVVFTISKPFAPFLRQLTNPIAPKHWFESIPDWEKSFDRILSSTINPQDIVYSGAYHLKKYVPAQRVVFEKNPNYYEINLNNEKLPYLNQIVYLIVGDLNNEILKFEAKEIDTISLRGSTVARYKAKESLSDYAIYNLGADTGTMFLAINLNNRKNDKGKYYVSSIKQQWFSDINFRTAIDYAIDRNSLVTNIAQGLAVPLFTSESLNGIYLNKNIKGHKRDLKLAEQYLAKSGFCKHSDGLLYDRKGHKVEFDLYTNAGNTERESIGVMLKQDLSDLGMTVNFKPVEFNTLVNKLTNSYDWDMAIMGLTGSPLEPHNGKNVWASNGPLHLFNQRPMDYKIDDRLSWEKELDNIFEQGALKLNFNDRKKYYDRYQEIVYNERPIIYLYSPTRIVAIRRKFKNIYPTTLSGILYNMEEIWIGSDK